MGGGGGGGVARRTCWACRVAAADSANGSEQFLSAGSADDKSSRIRLDSSKSQ